MKKNRWLIPGLLTGLLLIIGLLWLSPIRNLVGRIIQRKPVGRPDRALELDSRAGRMGEGERAAAEKIHIPAEKKSYLSTIYGKALDARSEHPILGDTFADEAVRRIDFDFEKMAVAIRAKQFDRFTSDWIAENPESTVLHLGCGLDSRIRRQAPVRIIPRSWDFNHLADCLRFRQSAIMSTRGDYGPLSPRTTKLYDRTNDAISPDAIERILILRAPLDARALLIPQRLRGVNPRRPERGN